MKHLRTMTVNKAEQTDPEVTAALTGLLAILIEALPLIGTLLSSKENNCDCPQN